MMTFIDTHAHLYDERYDEDRAAMIARAEAAGVRQIIRDRKSTRLNSSHW